MEKIVQEVLNESKVVWPWPEISIDEGSESLFKILKANGYKEWKNPNLKNYKQGFRAPKARFEIIVNFRIRLYFLMKIGGVTIFDLPITMAKSKK